MDRMNKPTGGPAFPVPVQNYKDQEGMALRDYFAARAPDCVPAWFTHISPVKQIPPRPDWRELDEAYHSQAISWIDDPCFELDEEIQWFGEKVKIRLDALERWTRDDKAARFFQWRWFYADAMLAERAK